jgi:hypothetical protein
MTMRTLLVCMALAPVDAFRPKLLSGLARMDRGFVRESEFKHARVALLALPAFAALSMGGVDEPVKWLSEQPVDTQLSFFASASLVETFSLARLGPNFSLKEGLVPGNVVGVSNCSDALIEFELLAGRTAMICAAYVMSSALATST